MSILKHSLLFIFLLGAELFVSAQQPAYFDSAWTNYFRRNSGGWTAGDATISVPLPDNRVIWLFGDSYTVNVNITDNTLPCLFQVRNCYMVQDSVDRSLFKTILDTTMTGVNQTTFKIVPNDTTLLWPGHGYVKNDTVFIFMERYHSSTLAYLGCWLVKLKFPDLHQIGIYPVHGNGENVIFGRAVIVDSAAGYLYIYGNKLNWIVQEPVVARCSIANPLLPWEYYTGSGWSSFPNQMQKISTNLVSPGFSAFKYEGKYYIVTQENGYLECGLGREIYSYESLYPWGPFENKKLLYTEESKFNGWYLLTYNAQAHPYFIENNELLICYNVNDRVDTVFPHVCPSECKHIWTDRMDADSYRPKFVRVPMGLITDAGCRMQDERYNNIEVQLGPNPVMQGADFICEIVARKATETEICLSDIYGRPLTRKVIQLQPGQNRIPFRSPGNKGVYLVTASGDGAGLKTAKLIVY